MFRLAYNSKAALFKVGREYWYVTSGFDDYGCFNSQSLEYDAQHAIDDFIERFGEAIWRISRKGL